MSAAVEENIFMARVAEQAERFEDMVNFLRPVLQEKGALITTDERNLLSVAFKNLISSKRSAWRTILAIEQNPKYTKFAENFTTYKKKISEAIAKDCETVITMIKSHVLGNASGIKAEDEPRAFFVKLIGDYYRYSSESASGEQFEHAK